MNYILKHILALSIIVTYNVNIIANSIYLKETINTITISAKNYTLDIHKIGFSFSILYKENIVLKTSDETPIFLTKDGKEYKLGKLLKYNTSGDSISLKYSTTLAKVTADIKIKLFNDYFTLDIKTNGINDKVGCNIQLQDGAKWYGGNITSAQNWPSNSASFEVDPFYSCSNQTSPIWINSNGVGIFINTYHTMGYSFNKGNENIFSFHVKNMDEINFIITVGATITNTYKSMIGIVGKPQSIPPKEYFSNSIFNSWIEFKKNVTQSGLLNYSEEIRKNRIPCSILEIDDMWTTYYGEFNFDPTKFPDPKEMVKKLNTGKFKVVLWVTPFVEKNASTFSYLASKGFLIRDAQNREPYITEWWNGSAALIDFSNPEAYDWFLKQLKNLHDNYGVDGFKFDAGDADFLDKPFKTYENISSSKYTDLFASLGQYFEINELRVSWLTQSFGLVQRLRDKSSDWTYDKGIGSIIPHGMTEGLIGYPYFCPDMIGGGEIASFSENKEKVDRELFIRWAQVSAFMPMMQYSFAPWKLDSMTTTICRKYSEIHEKLGDYIYKLAKDAQVTGNPIVRPLFFQYPKDSMVYSISNQFMLGDKFLVAPILTKGSESRNIYLPDGTWIDYWNGNIIKGGQTIIGYPASIEKLPVFINIY